MDKTLFEDAFAKAIKKLAGCQVHLKNINYDKIKLSYPRVVVDIGEPQYLARHSNHKEYTKSSDPDKIKRFISQQFTGVVTLTAIGSPDDNLAHDMITKVRNTLFVDYDILLADEGLNNIAIQDFGPILDISVELETKIENRFIMTLLIHGTDTIIDDEIGRVAEVSYSINDTDIEIKK
jgi:hypothetical protein